MGAKWERRAEVLRAAYAAHPEQFPRGVPVPPPLPTAAWINKPASPAEPPAQGAPHGHGAQAGGVSRAVFAASDEVGS